MKWKSILRVVLVPLAIAAAVLCAFLIFRARIGRQMRQRAYGTLDRFALQQTETLHTRIDEQYGVLDAMAAYAAEHWNDPSGRSDGLAFARALTGSTVLTHVAYVRADGDAVLDDGSTTNIADRAYFQESMRGGRGLEKIDTGELPRSE